MLRCSQLLFREYGSGHVNETISSIKVPHVLELVLLAMHSSRSTMHPAPQIFTVIVYSCLDFCSCAKQEHHLKQSFLITLEYKMVLMKKYKEATKDEP